jgi:hypothetical protein
LTFSFFFFFFFFFFFSSFFFFSFFFFSFFFFSSCSPCSARPSRSSWYGEHADPGSGEGKSKCF